MQQQNSNYGIPCPSCGHTKSDTVNSRPSPKGTIRRRRCCKCYERYTTYEKIYNKTEIEAVSHLNKLLESLSKLNATT